MTHTLFAQDPQAQPPPPAQEGQKAQQAQEGQKPQQEQPQGSLLPIYVFGLLLLFWVVVVLPASRRGKREHQQALAVLKRGAKILTSGGIVATVVSAKEGEDEIVIRSEDTRLRIKRSVVVQVLGTDEAEAAKA